MNKFHSILLLLTISISFTFQSCKKDDAPSPQETIEITQLTQSPIPITAGNYTVDGGTSFETDYVALIEIDGLDGDFFDVGDRSESVNFLVSLGDDFMPNGEIVTYVKNGTTYTAVDAMVTTTSNSVTLSGEAFSEDASDSVQINLVITENQAGAGNSVLEVSSSHTATLVGTLGTMTYNQVLDLNRNHPEVNTIVFGTIEGSVNDDVNVETGRLIRQAGYRTQLLSESEIYSGGVDLFVSGKTRVIGNGATIGVHSWCCYEGLPASELAMDSPGHDTQLAYFREMLGSDNGEDFYFFTINAAPFDGIHLMTPQEIEQYQLATD